MTKFNRMTIARREFFQEGSEARGVFLEISGQLPEDRPQVLSKGVGPKEQREYEHIKESAEKSGRYGKRAEEVAARTVMKHHKQKGHKPGQ